MFDISLLLLGVLTAAIGGELFVQGSVGLASGFRISAGIVGVTLAAFGTSSPEFAVSVSAALRGSPELSLGDILGSNVVNIGLLLGLAVAAQGLTSPTNNRNRDLPVACLAPVITALLALDGKLSRIDGCGLLILFAGWLTLTIRDAWSQRRRNGSDSTQANTLWAGSVFAAGLGLLLFSGWAVVKGAIGLASAWGISEFLIGATIVSVGTSAPELATILISKWRGHPEVGLGTVLGSNLFNGLFILGIAAVIAPIRIEGLHPFVALGFGLVTLLVARPNEQGFLSSRRGWWLLGIYLVYLLAVLQNGPAE